MEAIIIALGIALVIILFAALQKMEVENGLADNGAIGTVGLYDGSEGTSGGDGL